MYYAKSDTKETIKEHTEKLLKNLKLLKNKYGNENTDFFVSPIKDFHSDLLFDCCVSNMVFMSDPEIEQSLKNIYANLKNDGLLYIMITHPCFWPTYWGYQNEEWFNYYGEISEIKSEIAFIEEKIENKKLSKQRINQTIKLLEEEKEVDVRNLKNILAGRIAWEKQIKKLEAREQAVLENNLSTQYSKLKHEADKKKNNFQMSG